VVLRGLGRLDFAPEEAGVKLRVVAFGKVEYDWKGSGQAEEEDRIEGLKME
jgi:hypothetical protein